MEKNGDWLREFTSTWNLSFWVHYGKNAGFGYQHVDFTMQNGDLGIWELIVGETIKTGTKTDEQPVNFTT